MHKSFTTAVNLLAAGMLLGNALAQQTPAATNPSPVGSVLQSTSQASTTKGGGAVAESSAPLVFKTQREKFSYALGMRMGENFRKQSVEVDPNVLAWGIQDALAGNKMLLTDEEAQAVMMEMQKDVQKQQQEKNQQAGVANKKEGDAFLAGNKGKPGVVTLPSGLQYKILKEGAGPKPVASDSVVCNYRGTLINGTEFDSSYKRGKPATFPVTGVIKGWTEALQLMPVGSKWQLFIPSDLAYGERGAGADITPNSTLIFEIELLSIEEKSKDQTPEKK